MLIDQIRRLLLGGLDLLGDYQILKAQVARLAEQVGVSLEIPQSPGAEVTPEIRARILATRERYTEEEWLLSKGPRDQICVRFNLSRQQVAGVLSGQSARRNGDEAIPPTRHAGGEGQLGGTITEDPATWPARDGCPAPPPKEPIHELDEIDRQIARAVLAAGEWSHKRLLIGRTRGLTGQQIAGIKAALTRRADPVVSCGSR